MNWTLVAYDISDDRRRAAVARTLIQLGQRAQYSVFLIPGRSPSWLASVLSPLIQQQEDNIRIYPLCRGCLKKAVCLGLAKAAVPETGGYQIL